jgi:uncharacterized damage-inducible protein DinB
MNEPMTKAMLLETLRARRAEWDAALAEVPIERMTEPGVAGAWSVKDIVAHLTYYERWFADRLQEQLRGDPYIPTALDFMGDARNDVLYEQNRERPLDEVLADSRATFQRLLAGVEAHSEAFLTTPQHFEGAPGPVLIWQMLRGDVYDHYPQHIPAIRHWLAARGAS